MKIYTETFHEEQSKRSSRNILIKYRLKKKFFLKFSCFFYGLERNPPFLLIRINFSIYADSVYAVLLWNALTAYTRFLLYSKFFKLTCWIQIKMTLRKIVLKYFKMSVSQFSIWLYESVKKIFLSVRFIKIPCNLFTKH